MKTVIFKRVHSASRGSSSYRAEGFPGVIYLAKPCWNSQHPEELVIENVPEPIARVGRSAADKIAKQLAKAQARVAELTLKANEAREERFITPVEDIEVVSRAPKPATQKLLLGSVIGSSLRYQA